MWYMRKNVRFFSLRKKEVEVEPGLMLRMFPNDVPTSGRTSRNANDLTARGSDQLQALQKHARCYQKEENKQEGIFFPALRLVICGAWIL